MQLSVWKAPGCAWSVVYPPALVEQLRRHVLDAFFAVPRGGAEAGGVLYGSREGSTVRIEAFRPLECEHRSGPSFTLSPADHARMQALMTPPEGLEVAGWYHSHTRGGLCLSPEDVELHERYFPEPWQVALLLRPSAMLTRAGFFAPGPDGKLRAETTHMEFVVRPLAGVEPMAPAPEPEPSPQPEPGPAPVPDAGSRRLWLVAPLALALAAAAYFLYRHRQPAPRTPVALTATDREGLLEIHWNPNAPAVREAAAARLEIADGDLHPAAVLAPAHVQAGAFVYARQTARVDVRLVLERPGARRHVEGVTFLGAPPRPNAASELQHARTELVNQAMEIQELRRTIDKLKSKR